MKCAEHCLQSDFALPGHASRRAGGPVAACFVWEPLAAQWFRHRFQVRFSGTWQESSSMNLGSQKGSVWWSAWKGRMEWATPGLYCWTRGLAAFKGAWGLVLSPGFTAVQQGYFTNYRGVLLVNTSIFYWTNNQLGWQLLDTDSTSCRLAFDGFSNWRCGLVPSIRTPSAAMCYVQNEIHNCPNVFCTLRLGIGRRKLATHMRTWCGPAPAKSCPLFEITTEDDHVPAC